ncbi:hypothetical protein UFOVP733_55 [uncultured Caudovirales phage]|uniref:Bacteriophage P22, Gp10, DNA-stabilising n=1 Tax=uncultured Caudovirales phage TaxID=2100421 RepID=A0A6J7X537_9CAUD|nr:hypothetical protein UFOVP733_55 [uncultured Caudovirales phage]CAB5224779.1 hypothetical protein UFOVP743_4 [uncultured Caudovirales phage]
MPSNLLDIVGAANPARYKKLNAEGTYNMIITDIDEDNKVEALVPYAGYQTAAEIVADLGARGFYISPNAQVMIAVFGRSVVSITASQPSSPTTPPFISYFQVGSMNTDTGFVYITENEAGQITLSDGVYNAIYNWKENSFENILPPFSPVHNAYMDGYTIYADGATNEFRLSALNNAAIYPAEYTGALQTKTANRCVAVAVNGRQLFVFGLTVTEVYFDNPSPNTGVVITMPYQRDSSINIDYGCINAATVKVGFGMVAWIGISEISNPVILVSTGGNPKVISTDGINFIMSNLKNPSNCYSFLFQQDGHIFYQTTWVDDNLTLIYDFKKDKFFYGTDTKLNYHIAKFVVYYKNTHYMLSSINNNLYELSSSIYTYDGEIIPRLRITKPKRTLSYQNFRIKELGIICETGNVEEDMVINLSISKDGGYSFGNNVARNLNPLGMRRKLVRWKCNMGTSRDWVFQFRFEGSSYFAIVSAYTEDNDDPPVN